jgi:hypothetical protein
MATSPLFGWEEPDDVDLVKDGAAAIRTLGNAIDTSMGDLLGGTTGQVLSKNSNTNMDFTWVTSDDANAIQNTIVDAKGDLISATGSDVPARLAVGANGETLVADSSTSTGLRYTSLFGANKNAILNGDFTINQRNFSSVTTAQYTFDRWNFVPNDGTVTCSVQQFTAGTAPVAGYESKQFARVLTASQTAAGAYSIFEQRIENVRTFAGQTMTMSFWAKAASGTPKVALEITQNFGSGGSPSSVARVYGGQVTISTSWARYSITYAIPSLSGKTVGTTDNTSALVLSLWTSAGTDFNARTGSIGIQNNTIDFWGVQAENGSVATAFQTATGTIQGELAACQRYFQTLSFAPALKGISTTEVQAALQIPPMRTSPTGAVAGAIKITNDVSADFNQSSGNITLLQFNANGIRFKLGNFTGLVVSTIYAMYNPNGTDIIQLSAEL